MNNQTNVKIKLTISIERNFNNYLIKIYFWYPSIHLPEKNKYIFKVTALINLYKLWSIYIKLITNISIYLDNKLFYKFGYNSCFYN